MLKNPNTFPRSGDEELEPKLLFRLLLHEIILTPKLRLRKSFKKLARCDGRSDGCHGEVDELYTTLIKISLSLARCDGRSDGCLGDVDELSCSHTTTGRNKNNNDMNQHNVHDFLKGTVSRYFKFLIWFRRNTVLEW